jgi:hypothetical protein
MSKSVYIYIGMAVAMLALVFYMGHRAGVQSCGVLDPQEVQQLQRANDSLSGVNAVLLDNELAAMNKVRELTSELHDISRQLERNADSLTKIKRDDQIRNRMAAAAAAELDSFFAARYR